MVEAEGPTIIIAALDIGEVSLATRMGATRITSEANAVEDETKNDGPEKQVDDPTKRWDPVEAVSKAKPIWRWPLNSVETTTRI